MKMSPSISRPRAFTLLELLVVIAIIGVLAGLMYPATTGALRRAERTHAENTAYNLKNAISAYFTEYRKYPVDPSNTNDTAVIRTNSDLMDVLLGADSQKESGGLNPRGVAFYTDKAAKPAGDGKYRKGVRLEADGGGELWDPYGDYYYVRMDLDYNNRVEKPSWDEANDAQVLPESILVWSAGKDQDETTSQDNIKTW
ncbi:MAG: prepilin-type N-terminal cleavage/methylation domain-containing protein [Verrucomicrobiales bacterium]|nr:prepilin-type N-terminal cleavage/methylation domain-containing protein [Verrucomicrobiales bacterium]